MKNYEIKPVAISFERLLQYENFLSGIFPRRADISKDYLEWLYSNNPNGKVLGYDAWFGKDLVAHYVCIPRKAYWRGKIRKILLSLNTATHHAHRNKGLFTLLAKRTYKKAKIEGFEAIVGVANSNSTHGFINKLEFSFITALNIQVGFGKLNIKLTDILNSGCFRIIWTNRDIKWRLNCPREKVFIKRNQTVLSFFTLKYSKFFVPYAENPFIKAFSELKTKEKKGFKFMRLFVGLVPTSVLEKNFFFNLPYSLKPAPLNLIFKSLTEEENVPLKENIFFTFLDFDIL